MSGAQFNINDWLQSIGLSRYVDDFVRHKIDRDILHELDSQDLIELGMPVGDRERFLRKVDALENDNQPFGMESATSPDAQPVDVGRSERRHVTVMFVDMTDSNRLSSILDPEDYASTIEQFQRCTIELVEQWRGFVARIFGNGVLAYFGWPAARENDAERAVRAALDISSRISELKAPGDIALGCKTGIATGLVVVEDIASNRSAYHDTIYGVTPNLAARMQAQADKGEVIVSVATHQLVHHWFKTSLLGKVELKGIQDRTEVWRVDKAHRQATRFNVNGDKLQLTPIAGRDAELSCLHRQWTAASAGRGSLVTVFGEAGLGKSRLIREFCESQKHSITNTFYLQCSPFHENTTAYPLIEYFNGLLNQSDDSSSDSSAAQSLASILAAARIVDSDAADTIAWFMGLADINIDSSPALLAAKAHDIFVRYLCAAALNGPAVIILEDAHWIDATTAAIIEQLVAELPEHSLLVVISARSEFNPQWCSAAKRIELQPLKTSEAIAICTAITGSKTMPKALAKKILDATNGNPLFLEELTKTLIDTKQMDVEGGALTATSSLETMSIPNRLRDSLAAKIDMLTDAKVLACQAASIGYEFSFELLRSISGLAEAALLQQLQQMHDAGIVVTAGKPKTNYRFTNTLLHEAAYSLLLFSAKRQRHLQIAKVLENSASTDGQNSAENIARHYERADKPLQAATHLLAASEQALSKYATKEALALLQHGINLLSELEETDSQAELLMHLHASSGMAHMLTAGWGSPDVDKAYSKALSYRSASVDKNEHQWISWGAWVYRHVSGQSAASVQLADEIMDTARRDDDPDRLLVAHMVQFQTHFFQGKFQLALEHGENVPDLYDQSRHASLRSRFSLDLLLVWHVHEAQLRWLIGDSPGARTAHETVNTLAADIDHAHSHAWAHSWSANYLLLAGEYEQILETLPSAIEYSASRGFDYSHYLARVILAIARLQKDPTTQNYIDSEEALSQFRSTGAQITVPYFLTCQARALVCCNKLDDAHRKVTAALEQTKRYGECWAESFTLLEQGSVQLLQKNHGPQMAEQSYIKALRIAKRQHALQWHQATTEKLQHLLEQQDRLAELEHLQY